MMTAGGGGEGEWGDDYGGAGSGEGMEGVLGTG